MRSSVGSISSAPEASHRLLHIVANGKNFKMQHLEFASKWVAEEFVKKATRDELQAVISLLASSSGALKGMLYEPVMHTVLSQGGCFTAVPVMYDNTSTFWRGVEEKLVLDRCTTQEFFQVLPKIAKPQVYYRPSSPIFPTMDAFMCGTNTCDIFQMTVQDSKELDASKLNSLLHGLQLPAKVTPRLHFVVPEDRYSDFKLKAGEIWPPKRRQAALRMKLYIVKGVYARLQVCARSGHVGCHAAGGGRKLWL
ncbi:hypothetical protein GPECTOR_16g755 [Gonium pectorale]|uniref:Uncharacterized protein n=1 Tax=Gonium pectorale TaxID=33097 RepID=A0A150GML5_GONPE|nr:hypothetical protein GPECTOR_16g755 [Gonium pectorale]|eukprot:KXZ50580.1 hypothetical protein GPECTOR_16g755 [Gonium pectorale]